MAKIILRTNTNSSGFYIQGKTLSADIGSTPTEKSIDLRISPSSGYVLEVSDFSHGPLPDQVRSLSFSQSSQNIILTVNLSNFIVSEDIVNVYLPISGQAKKPKGKLTVSVLDSKVEGIINSGLSGSRTFEGEPGSQTFLFKKIFTPDQGYEFKSKPNYVISGDSGRYTVARQTIGASEIFNFYYDFPTQSSITTSSDSVRFTVDSRKIAKAKDIITYAEKKEDYQIYSIDTGAKVSSKGGVKKVVVKGVPGTPFKILIQDTAKKVYNFDTGSFEDGGKFLEGIVPKAKQNVNYGVFRAYVNVPASATENVITSRIYVDNPVTTFGVSNPTQDASTTDIATATPIIEEAVRSLSKATFSLNATIDWGGTTGLVVNRTALINEDANVANGTYVIGNSDYGNGIDEYFETNPIILQEGYETKKLSWIVTTDDDAKSIRIIRQPFYSPEITFNNVDHGNDTEFGLISEEGVPYENVFNDWQNTYGTDAYDESGWYIKNIETSVTGNSDGVDGIVTVGSTEFQTHSQVTITVEVTGNFGKADITPTLRLSNFLTIH